MVLKNYDNVRKGKGDLDWGLLMKSVFTAGDLDLAIWPFEHAYTVSGGQENARQVVLKKQRQREKG